MAKRFKTVELASSAEELEEAKSKKAAKKPAVDPLEYMEGIVNDMMLDLQNNKLQQVKTTRQFRTSSLPFCPILEFIKDPNIEEYSKSHYTTTGTAIHETIQSWLSVSKFSQDMIYGSWKCTGCQTVKLNQMRPKKLCGCSHTVSTTEFHRGWPKHWTYVEVEYDYHGLTGHIDLVVIPRPDFAFPVDFKTTELAKKKLRWSWKEDKVSSPNYVAQVRTYSTILDKVHGLPIKGWMLVNTERGSPIRKRSDFHPQVAKWSSKHSEKWMKVLDLSIENNKRLRKLEDAIDSEDKQLAEKQLRRIVVNRPCHSQDDYNDYMRYKFYSGECPHQETCFHGSNKAIFNMIMGELAKKE